MQSNSREKILHKIAAVRSKRVAAVDFQLPENFDSNIHKPILPDPVSCFKAELEAINGKCVLCKDEMDQILQLKEFLISRSFSNIFCLDDVISDKLTKNEISISNNPENFENMDAGITSCEFLVARTGSVMVSSASTSGRQMNVFPPVHIVLAKTSQLVNYLTDALEAIQKKYPHQLPSSISTITGPSRTADIEKTLVLGAHGPKEFIVFLSGI